MNRTGNRIIFLRMKQEMIRQKSVANLKKLDQLAEKMDKLYALNSPDE